MVRQLAKRGDKVIAACRNPSKATELQALKAVFVYAAVAQVEAIAPNGFDVLVNNAGISDDGAWTVPVDQTDLDELRTVFDTNVVAMSQKSVIANMSSILGSVTTMTQFGDTVGLPYRASKAAVNMVSVQFANLYGKQALIIFPLHPGWVQTDMGGSQAPLQPPESVSGMLNIIDNATPATNGKCMQWNGQTLGW
ncbi:hypothetical protein BZG36_05183 [Bifiguratus adelaidae]|uniref:Uncharacterized protein n=1 Tax=Bifiguratus adelaidae TaxID=1938954 RepID=A0A261XU04_9FUNG|nr:hypothetical protein BZG36_05183 [Bifiguratus adelaidae]